MKEPWDTFLDSRPKHRLSRKSERFSYTIDEIIESLHKSKKFGFETSPGSSPIVPLLNAAIDLMILLKDGYENNSPLEEKSNPEIKFLDIADSLGNPKSVKIFKRSKRVSDPDAKKIFLGLASFFSSLRGKKTIKSAFMANLMPIFQPEMAKKELKEKRAKGNRNVFFYHWRVSKKKFIN